MDGAELIGFSQRELRALWESADRGTCLSGTYNGYVPGACWSWARWVWAGKVMSRSCLTVQNRICGHLWFAGIVQRAETDWRLDHDRR